MDRKMEKKRPTTEENTELVESLIV